MFQGAKRQSFPSIYIPTLTYGHDFWLEAERLRLRIRYKWPTCVSSTGWLGSPLEIGCRAQTSKRSLKLKPLQGASWGGLGIWSGRLQGAFLWRFSGPSPTGRRPQGRARTEKWSLIESPTQRHRSHTCTDTSKLKVLIMAFLCGF